jgi:ribonuclease P protein component
MAAALSAHAAPRAVHVYLCNSIDLCPGSQQFPVRARLTRPAEFQHVFKHCQYRVSNRWITLLAVPNHREFTRLGLAISRKVARTAVARNRVKRVSRESFRKRQYELGALDVVILGRNDLTNQSKRVLGTAMDNLWTQLIATCAGSSSN